MSRKSSVNKIKEITLNQKIEASLCMYLYEKSHSPISTHVTISEIKSVMLSQFQNQITSTNEVKISRADYKKDFIKRNILI
jgi:hypothetical protein